MLSPFITKYNLWQSEEQSANSILGIRLIWVCVDACLLLYFFTLLNLCKHLFPYFYIKDDNRTQLLGML